MEKMKVGTPTRTPPHTQKEINKRNRSVKVFCAGGIQSSGATEGRHSQQAGRVNKWTRKQPSGRMVLKRSTAIRPEEYVNPLDTLRFVRRATCGANNAWSCKNIQIGGGGGCISVGGFVVLWRGLVFASASLESLEHREADVAAIWALWKLLRRERELATLVRWSGCWRAFGRAQACRARRARGAQPR